MRVPRLKRAAEEPYNYCEQTVSTNGASHDATLLNERLIAHVVNSDAYKEAVKRDTLRRVNVTYRYATYSFNIFLDKASEQSGFSLLMGWAVSTHLSMGARAR